MRSTNKNIWEDIVTLDHFQRYTRFVHHHPEFHEAVEAIMKGQAAIVEITDPPMRSDTTYQVRHGRVVFAMRVNKQFPEARP